MPLVWRETQASKQTTLSSLVLPFVRCTNNHTDIVLLCLSRRNWQKKQKQLFFPTSLKKEKTKLKPQIIFHQLIGHEILAPSSFHLSRSELFFWLSVPQHIPGKWSLLWVMAPILRPHRGWQGKEEGDLSGPSSEPKAHSKLSPLLLKKAWIPLETAKWRAGLLHLHGPYPEWKCCWHNTAHWGLAIPWKVWIQERCKVNTDVQKKCILPTTTADIGLVRIYVRQCTKSSQPPYGMSTNIIPLLWMEKLRHRKVRHPAQGHTAGAINHG